MFFQHPCKDILASYLPFVLWNKCFCICTRCDFPEKYAVEIAISYWARQYVDEKHEFLKETLSTSKETYHHRLCSLVRDHDFVSKATMKLEDENTQYLLYEQKLGKNCTINRGLLPKISLISKIQYGGQLRKSTEQEKILHMHWL